MTAIGAASSPIAGAGAAWRRRRNQTERRRAGGVHAVLRCAAFMTGRGGAQKATYDPE